MSNQYGAPSTGLPFTLISSDGSISFDSSESNSAGQRVFDLTTRTPNFPTGSIPASAIQGCPPGCGTAGGSPTAGGPTGTGSQAAPFVGFSGPAYVQPANEGFLHLNGSGANGGQLQYYDGSCWCDAAETLGALTLGAAFTDGNNSWQLVDFSGVPGTANYEETWEPVIINANGGVSPFNGRGSVAVKGGPIGLDVNNRPIWEGIRANNLPQGWLNYSSAEGWERWNGVVWEPATVVAPGFFWAEAVCDEGGEVRQCVLHTLCPSDKDCPGDENTGVPLEVSGGGVVSFTDPQSKINFARCFGNFFNVENGVVQIADSYDPETGEPVFSPCPAPEPQPTHTIMDVVVENGLTGIPNASVNGSTVTVYGVAGENTRTYSQQSLNTAGACGVFRTANNKIEGGDFQRVFLRVGECVTFTWDGNAEKWRVRHEWLLWSRDVWCENADGTVDMQGIVQLTSVGRVQDIALPVTVMEPRTMNVLITDLNNSNAPADGDPLPSARDGKHGFVNYHLANTTTSISIGSCYLGDTVEVSAFAISWRVDKALLDYSALAEME